MRQLVFGEPLETKDKLTAEAQVLPEVGKLVLFATFGTELVRFTGSERGRTLPSSTLVPHCFCLSKTCSDRCWG